MRRAFHFLFSIYGFIVFLAMMLLIFPFVIIASFFGRIRGGNAIYFLCRIWSQTVLFLWGIRHRNIYESLHHPDHPVIYVFNHTSYLDIPLLLVAVKRRVRVLGKAELSKIPVFGFIYRNAAVTVDRSNDDARRKSVLVLMSIISKNISIMLAPEGTFNATGKPLAPFFSGAFRISVDTQTSIRPVVFLDAFDRLNPRSIFLLNPGKSRAVFLPECSGTDPDELKARVYNLMEDCIIRYHAPWVKGGVHA